MQEPQDVVAADPPAKVQRNAARSMSAHNDQWPTCGCPEGFCTKKTQATAKSEMMAPHRKPPRTPPDSASTVASPRAVKVVARADINATNSATPAAPATC